MASGPELQQGGSKEKGNCMLAALRPTIFMQLASGNLILLARPFLALQCAGSPERSAAARAHLANAASLGSLGELLLGSLLGQLSDRHGRKPLLLFHTIAPMLAWLAVLMSGRSAAMRLRMLYLDMFIVRGFGMMSLVSMANVAISDVFESSAQPRARAAVEAMRALGVVTGSLVGGWLQAKRGPAAPYAVGLFLSSMATVNLIMRLPETHCQEAKESQVAKDVSGSRAPQGSSGGTSVLRTLLCDSESRYLVLLLAVMEMAHLPQFSEVASLMFRDILQWGPATSGRFIAAYGTASFFGSQATGALVDRFGPDLQATLSHIGIIASFLLWGAARNTATMVATLLPLTLSFGRGIVARSKAIARAEELGLGRGEAMAAMGMLSAIARMLAPRLFVALYTASSAAAGTGSPAGVRLRRQALPTGAPMFFLAALGVLLEALHRQAVWTKQQRST
mmetsp:Transcript_46685/g.99688  ORF Transcript_46685/g.99688 Transcript_46685/m.99688 type:complete len:452 (-) Transcript_46685:77-1432(-)